MTWIPLTESMPTSHQYERVLIYIEGAEDTSVYDVPTDHLNENWFADPSDQPDICRAATHWTVHPRYARPRTPPLTHTRLRAALPCGGWCIVERQHPAADCWRWRIEGAPCESEIFCTPYGAASDALTSACPDTRWTVFDWRLWIEHRQRIDRDHAPAHALAAITLREWADVDLTISAYRHWRRT